MLHLMFILLVAAPAAAKPDEIIVLRDPPAGVVCSDLGEVRSSSLLGGALTNVAYSKALGGLKRRAAGLGATHVVLVDTKSGFAGSNMLGRALLCAPPPAGAAAPVP